MEPRPASIVRVETAKGHYYVDAADKRKRIPGVTTILKETIPKPQLNAWFARMVAEEAWDRREELAGLPRAPYVEEVRNAADRRRDVSAARGTQVHKWAEMLSRGEQVDIPVEHVGYLDGYLLWLSEYEVVVQDQERTVWGGAGNSPEYAGTYDLMCTTSVDADDDPILVDIKTGRGLYAESMIQIAAYALADYELSDDGTTEQSTKQPRRGGLLHLHDDGTYKFVTFEIAEVSHLWARAIIWRTSLKHLESTWKEVSNVQH